MKWEKLKIKDFASVVTGGTPSTSVSEYWDNGNIPWLNSGELNQGIVTSCSNYITNAGLKNSSTKMMPPDTVLIALTGATTGVTGYLTFEASANQSVTGILPSQKHEPRYLYYYLSSIRPKILNDAYGGAQKHISQQYVKEIEVLLPPLHVQKKIADILDKADALRRKDQDLLKKYDRLAQAVFYEMFGDPRSNSKGWNILSLNEVCIKITDGTHFTPKYVEKGVPFLRVTDLTESNTSKKYISIEEHIELIKRCKPEKGDVLYTKNGTIGVSKPVTWDYEFSIFVSLCLLKPNKKLISTKFLSYFLNTPLALEQAVSHSKTGTITNLHLVEIKKIKLPVPPLEVQHKFESILDQIDNSKNKLFFKEKLDLFNSTSYKYFF